MPGSFSRRGFMGAAGGAVVAGAVLDGGRSAAAAPVRNAAVTVGTGVEPDIELAKLWWPNPRNVWTPIGWKDHLFRFNVVYNGSIVGAPCPPGRTTPGVEPYRGKGIQLDCLPWGGGGAFTSGPHPGFYPGHYYVYRDDQGHYGRGQQHWRDGVAPVLCTDWPMDVGVVLRQQVFAHLKGGKAVDTGTEPIYAWVRLSVEHVDEVKVSEGKVGLAVRVVRPCYTQEYPYNWQDGVTLTGYPENAPFPVDLSAKDTGRGVRVSHPDGVHLEAFSADKAPVWSQPKSDARIYDLAVELPAKRGAHTDILVAMLPQPAAEFDRELKLGFDGALKEATSYWSKAPSTASTVSTREKYVDDALLRSVQFADVVAQKTPDTDEYTYLTGSFGYDVLWSTPSSMNSHMLLDLLGHHESVARHIELYRTHQGTTPPPGKAYAKHPGYYGTPDHLKAVNWLADHGAIQLTVATHALLTGEEQFISHWLDSLVKACDFVKDACVNVDHEGIKGLPPPAVATDEGTETVSVWSLAWIYKGLTTTVRLLTELKHARAEEFADLAGRYKATFDKAFDEYGAKQPTWTHPNGRKYPVYSAGLIDTSGHEFAEAFRLDTGPLCLVWAGLMEASDERMRRFADYFRVGPDVTLWGNGIRKNPLARPILEREISSCEPCYSWNVVHSWQLGDRQRFLEGMYSLLAGALSPQTYIGGEHRHGMYGLAAPNALATWMIRHAVVDDEIVEGELHLLRLCPRAWISADQETVFAKMPTWYGPVTVRFKETRDGEGLNMSVSGSWRGRPPRVVLHFPPGVRHLLVDGRTFRPGSNGTASVDA